MYKNCSEPFLEYFRRDQRVITVDVLTHEKSYLQKRVKGILLEFGFNPVHPACFAVIFVLGQLRNFFKTFFRTLGETAFALCGRQLGYVDKYDPFAKEG